MRNTRLFLLVTALLWAGQAAAQPAGGSGKPLMLQEVVTSLSRHPLLQATEQGREQALAELRSAEGAFDTTVSFETSQFATG